MQSIVDDILKISEEQNLKIKVANSIRFMFEEENDPKSMGGIDISRFRRLCN